MSLRLSSPTLVPVFPSQRLPIRPVKRTVPTWQLFPASFP